MTTAVSWFQSTLQRRPSWGAENLSDKKIDSLTQLLKGTSREADVPEVIRIKKILKEQKGNPKVEALRKEYLALKLHIDSDVFDKNDGLYSFVKKFPLYNYLQTFKHPHLQVGSDGKVTILSEGKQVEWNSIAVPSADGLRQPFLYGEKGLQAQDLYAWETLTPFRTDGPKGRFLVEFCTTAADEERFNGDHSWIRLYKDTGEVYSVGLYRPFKRSCKDKWWFPLRTKEGELMSPDVSEFWGDDIHSIKMQITEKQFDAIKEKVESDKKRPIHYHVLGYNCTQWMMEIAKIAGAQFECTLHAGRVITPKRVVKLTDRYFHRLPRCIQRIAKIANTVFFNVIQCALGSAFVDRQVEQTPAYISRLIHLFDEKRLRLYSPYRLGKVIGNQVREWRIEEKARRAAAGENCDDVDYLLPPEMLLESSV